MRKERPFLADIYPAGKETCKDCGTTNLAGESFRMVINIFSTGKYCPDCYKVIEDAEKQEQTMRYASGEEEPECTGEITCPWCGYEEGDSWEAEDSDDERQCGVCDKIFSYERHVEVTYSSSRVEEEES